ncbi:MAG: choice-of-anchor U domain-containing protein [Pseudomonadota bacterium]
MIQLFKEIKARLRVVLFLILSAVLGAAAQGFAASPVVTVTIDPTSCSYINTVHFSATGVDAEDGDLAGDSSWTWWSSIDGTLGTGTEDLYKTNLSVGTHTIVASVTDADGNTGSKSGQLTIINNVPTVTINSVLPLPPPSGIYVYGTAITFEGSGTDVEDGPLSGTSLVWTSSQGDPMGIGSSPTVSTLTSGVHIIRLTATDSKGAKSFVTTTLEIGNAPPLVDITSPADGASFAYKAAITFRCNASDQEDITIPTNKLVWESDLVGFIGNGANFVTSSLPSGTHIITVTATDTNGISTSDSISVTVQKGSPTAIITDPAPGSNTDYGDPITFNGSGVDSSGNPITGNNLIWSSNIDGTFGTTATVTGYTLLHSGTHTITLTARDNDGLTGTTSIQIIVRNTPPTSATILAPVLPDPSYVFPYGTLITFQGTGIDPEDGVLAGTSLVWSSSQGDPMGTGSPLAINTLTSGKHIITLTVVDSKGLTLKDTIDIEIGNAPPTATITAPLDGSSHDYGSYITFQGKGTDPEDGNLTGAYLVWTSSSSATPLGQGVSLSVNTLPSGTHTITLTVTDHDGAVATDDISITVKNATPSVIISMPANNSSHAFGASITFEGSSNDPEDGPLTGGSLRWFSDWDGLLGTGGTITTSSLSVHKHKITLKATDSEGTVGEASITIDVSDEQPTEVNITAPVDGASFFLNDFIRFTGNATDKEDGALSGSSLKWYSSLNKDPSQPIGTGEDFATNLLVPGTHRITLVATDSSGNTRSVYIIITVVNRLPVVTITSPAAASENVWKDSIRFTGKAEDPEDGIISDSTKFKWISSLDGVLGTGSSLTLATLSKGTHVITLQVTDSNGGVGSAAVTIHVSANEPPTSVRIIKPLDGSVHILKNQILFEGTATDKEDGDLSGESLKWYSSLSADPSQPIGTGESFTTNALDQGQHLITLKATDVRDPNLFIVDFIAITVKNTLPVPVIHQPVSGSIFDEGESIPFRGSAQDTEDGFLSGAGLVWTSDLDGFLGVGVAFTHAKLTPGTHTITLTAKDANDGEVKTTITLTVTPSGGGLPLSVNPVSVTVPLDRTATAVISGGYPPYRVEKDYPLIVTVELVGDTLTVTPKSTGDTTLRVIDHNGNQKIVEVKVIQNSDEIPVAYAGQDQSTVVEGDTVQLDGTGTFQGTHGVAYWQWTQTQGPEAVLSNAGVPKATFVAPLTDDTALLRFQLSVMDNNGSFSSDEVEITVVDNGITQYPAGVTTFRTPSQMYPLGTRIVGQGDYVLLKGAYPEFINEKTNRPTNMIFDLIELKIKVLNPGDSAHLMLYFPQPLGQDFMPYKYSPSRGWYAFGGSVQFASDRTKAYITLVDGGDGDDDGVADGTITDPLTFGTEPLPPGPDPEPEPNAVPGGGGGGGCFLSVLFD